MIKTTGLAKTFTTLAGELTVLRGIDISVQPGEFVAIVGASGVGKSTLLHILGTLDRPSAGSVVIDGVDVTSLEDQAMAEFRNSKIGFVFQFHHLLPEFTALENVMMPALIGGVAHEEAAATARSLLEGLGLRERIEHRPGELSGGEQQRVAVARALMMSPKVVLADEPTGNLDTATGEELFALLREVNKKHNTTFLIVTHNDALSSRCDRVIEMRDGMLNS